MMVKRGYKAELDLNNEQITLAKKHCGAARWAFNYGLRRKQEAYKAGLPMPYATDLHREINALKKTAIPWMYEVSKCAPQETLRDLDDAFKHFFRKVALKKPLRTAQAQGTRLPSHECQDWECHDQRKSWQVVCVHLRAGGRSRTNTGSR